MGEASRSGRIRRTVDGQVSTTLHLTCREGDWPRASVVRVHQLAARREVPLTIEPACVNTTAPDGLGRDRLLAQALEVSVDAIFCQDVAGRLPTGNAAGGGHNGWSFDSGHERKEAAHRGDGLARGRPTARVGRAAVTVPARLRGQGRILGDETQPFTCSGDGAA